jgi:hypothetical protein
VRAAGIINRLLGSQERPMLAVDRWLEKHPEWFDRSRIDIAEGHEGWRQLIDNAFSSAEQILSDYPSGSFEIVQVKEKFGTLTIYLREEGLPADISARLREIMQIARTQSSDVCEICGASASLGRRRSNYSVRCTSCAPDGWAPMSVGG